MFNLWTDSFVEIENVRNNYEKKMIRKSFILWTFREYMFLRCPLVEVILTLLTDVIFEGVEIDIFVGVQKVSHWLCLHCTAFAFQIILQEMKSDLFVQTV